MELTNEQLCLQVQQGNQEALAELLERNQDFILHIARSVWYANMTFCRAYRIDDLDLMQEGNIKFASAANQFSEEYGAKFTTFCYCVLKNAMIDYLRTLKKHKDFFFTHTVDSLEEIAEREFKGVYDPYRFKTPERAYIEKETRQELREAWAAVTDRDRSYLGYRYGYPDSDSHKLEETARHYRLSPGRCKKAERTALNHIREKLKNPKKTHTEAAL